MARNYDGVTDLYKAQDIYRADSSFFIKWAVFSLALIYSGLFLFNSASYTAAICIVHSTANVHSATYNYKYINV